MTEPSFTLYKLIILYMLEKVDFPLTNSQISEFVLDKGYTTYFKLQQAISELLDAGFVREESTHSRTFYHLTEEGAETIRFFRGKISAAIQSDIDEFLKEKHYDLKNEVNAKADYFQNSSMEYTVRCQVIENNLPLIDLTLTVPSESEAKTMTNNWAQKNQEIYAWIMQNLL